MRTVIEFSIIALSTLLLLVYISLFFLVLLVISWESTMGLTINR